MRVNNSALSGSHTSSETIRWSASILLAVGEAGSVGVNAVALADVARLGFVVSGEPDVVMWHADNEATAKTASNALRFICQWYRQSLKSKAIYIAT